MSRISVDVGLFLNTSCVRIIYGVCVYYGCICTTSVARHQIMTCHVKIGVDMHVHTVVFVPSVDMSFINKMFIIEYPVHIHDRNNNLSASRPS
jgi:hypothetical protein